MSQLPGQSNIFRTLSVQDGALKLYAHAGYTETSREKLIEEPEKGFVAVSFAMILATV